MIIQKIIYGYIRYSIYTNDYLRYSIYKRLLIIMLILEDKDLFTPFLLYLNYPFYCFPTYIWTL